MEKKIFCTYCGKEMIYGTNFCEVCGQIVKQPETMNKTQISTHQGNLSFTSPDYQSKPQIKRPGIEIVANKPKFFSLKELKDLSIAYLVIYLGFVARRIFVTSDIVTSVLETIILILAIFGVWFLLDKIVNYHYNYYPKFIYDPEKSFMALIFAFIFIGFPPGHYDYKLWMNRLPNPNNIFKVQLIIFYLFIGYGWFWYMLMYFYSSSFLAIFSVIPFIIAISVGLAIIPIGNFQVIFKKYTFIYFILAGLTIGLFIGSYQLLITANI